MTFRSKKNRNRKLSEKSRKSRKSGRNRKSNKNKRFKKYGGSIAKININYIVDCYGTYKIVQTDQISVDATIGDLVASRNGELLYGTPPNLKSLYSLPSTALVRAVLPTYDGMTYNVYFVLSEETRAKFCDPDIDPEEFY